MPTRLKVQKPSKASMSSSVSILPGAEGKLVLANVATSCLAFQQKDIFQASDTITVLQIWDHNIGNC